MSDKSTEVSLYQLPVAPVELEAAFISADFTDRLIESIRTNAKSLVADVTTTKGRKALISMAATVRSSKVAIDNAGKNLVAEMKKRPALVDESRRKIREALDELAVEIRQPVTEYEEAEAARLEAIKIALLHDEALIMNDNFDKARAEKFEADHELALLMNDKFDSDKIEAERIAEQQRIDYEQRIAREAEERVKREAEEKAQRDREEVERRERELQAAAEKERHERIAAQERAEREAKEARDISELKAKRAQEKAEREKQEAIEAERRKAAQAEQDRLAEEKRIKDEADRRAKDTEHRRQVNNDILSALTELGASDGFAKELIKAMATNQIPSVKINY